jgi:predicted RecB family nuclease
MKREEQNLVFSPTDIIRYVASPFASWMDRYSLDFPGALTPDEETEDQKLIARTGYDHERAELTKFRSVFPALTEISGGNPRKAFQQTLAAMKAGAPIIYQACLTSGRFSGYSDFLVRDPASGYEVWDTKLAVAPKPYYAIQLCCYSEMLSEITGAKRPKTFGIILGNGEKVEFMVEDFFDYYLRIKSSFLAMQDGFSGKLPDCPEPRPRADHGRWNSHAQKFFDDKDHLVNVANITVAQIKKLTAAGITTMARLAESSNATVPRFAQESLQKLAAQAALQCRTRTNQKQSPDCPPAFELLPYCGPNGEPVGLAQLPSASPADVFFDMEGYPLVPGGLEYLFGACSGVSPIPFEFLDWWAHDRNEEKVAFERFIDWVYAKWKDKPGMHIYHYAAYEVSALRRLSTRHDTRQDEVDQLLRNNVFVDLYQVVRHGLRIGAESYSIKVVERLYRPKRQTEVATAVDSIVQYARWLGSKEGRDWKTSKILSGIREYNEDDCKSTSELLNWLRTEAAKSKISANTAAANPVVTPPPVLSPEAEHRLIVAASLRNKGGEIPTVLSDLIDFHRREAKPIWWRMFDRAVATPEELRDDPGCVEGVAAFGTAVTEKQSLVQAYKFDPSQECKLAAGEKSKVMFSYNLVAKFSLVSLDTAKGELRLKLGKKTLTEKFGGAFPKSGSLLQDEFVPPGEIPDALAAVAEKELANALHPPVRALLNRAAPTTPVHLVGENPLDAALRVTRLMDGGCFVIQGPPGTGKTYTAAWVIVDLLARGKRVGVTSNSHKAIVNLLEACGESARKGGKQLLGIKVGGEGVGKLFDDNPAVRHVEDNPDGRTAYNGGVVGGTAWLFARPEWEGALDFLFVDEAGQVPLANAVAVARSAANLVLLGDQMQLEQPVQGSHPGDAGLSSLQYALKDTKMSKADSPVFHAVVPNDYGLFLGESRRMHPSVCSFISESIYEGRLKSHSDCANQKIACPHGFKGLVNAENGILFRGLEHDGNIQRSDEEVAQVKQIFDEIFGRQFTEKNGSVRPLALDDFLFVAPYNAQVRALQEVLPSGARVGSVDKFQGQEAPVCIISLCSSFGEYGSRGLSFILDRNRMNVAISRAKCLAIVVADPRIATNEARSIEEMTLTNLFCKLVRVGGS